MSLEPASRALLEQRVEVVEQEALDPLLARTSDWTRVPASSSTAPVHHELHQAVYATLSSLNGESVDVENTPAPVRIVFPRK